MQNLLLKRDIRILKLQDVLRLNKMKESEFCRLNILVYLVRADFMFYNLTTKFYTMKRINYYYYRVMPREWGGFEILPYFSIGVHNSIKYFNVHFYLSLILIGFNLTIRFSKKYDESKFKSNNLLINKNGNYEKVLRRIYRRIFSCSCY